MRPFLKLSKVWPWLPHFRVVAEVESLSRAARRFGMTSAALSKAIRTLEKLLDTELFDRSGGKLRLNDHGRALLGTVRASMRDLDDAITTIHTPLDSLRVAVDPAFSTLVLTPSSTSLELVDPSMEIAAGLLRGDVDAIVHVDRATHPDLDSARIALLERRVFGAKGHLATGSLTPSIGDEVAFAVVPGDESRAPIALSSLAHVVAWVASGGGLAVLPSVIGRAFGLHAVEVASPLSPVALWITIRRPRGARSAAAEWREAVRAHCVTL
ncbi:MAG: LysR family transcriptional regulator [Kofleriaceae bacterium]